MSTKPTNPKDALSVAKVPFFVLPFRVLRGVALALLEGALKYGFFNWRSAGVRATVYTDAAMGHIGDWLEGQDLDADSGLSHIDKAIASLVVLRDGMYEGNWVDDRPLAARGEYVSRNDPRVAALLARYPTPAKGFTEKDRLVVGHDPKACSYCRDETARIIAKQVQAVVGPPRAAAEADDGWIEWHGGTCPAEGRVGVRLRGGAVFATKAQSLRWHHTGAPGDIVAYQFVK